MAKKTSNKSSKARRQRSREPKLELSQSQDFDRSEDFNQRESMSAGERDYKDILRELVSNPAVKYIAGGIATALLTRLANNMSARYPELSSFIKENLDNLEGRLGEYSREFGNNSQARH